MNGTELVEKARVARAVGAQVEIVGQWVWAQFESKPPVETRAALKEAGYHWNAKREVWQYAGVPSRYSPAMSQEIKAKYGVVAMEEALA